MTEIAEPCRLCAGAYCESMVIPLPSNPAPDVVRWLGMRGEITHGHLRINQPCANLGDDGACLIYDRRPQPCREYPVGSPECRSAVIRFRSTTAPTILASLDAWESSNSRGPRPRRNSSSEASSAGGSSPSS